MKLNDTKREEEKKNTHNQIRTKRIILFIRRGVYFEWNLVGEKSCKGHTTMVVTAGVAGVKIGIYNKWR